MNNIEASFVIAKINENQYDIIVFGEQAVLDAFSFVYQNVFYIEKSKFEQRPIVVVPDFPNQQQARIWKEYWEAALADPENSCESCPSVKAFFDTLWASREKYQNSK